MAELAPGAYTHAGGIPAQAGFVGSLGEPEVAVVEQVEHGGIIEYGRVFALFLAIIAGHADVFVSGQKGLEVLELLFIAFLGSEDVEFVEAYNASSG